MVKETILKKEFAFLKKEKKALAVLLFGSQVKGKATRRSDIDVCIVVPTSTFNERSELLRKVWASPAGKYDVKLFEDLPLYLKASVVANYEVVWARDLPELGEYFYFWSKLWADQAHRQALSKAELATLLS